MSAILLGLPNLAARGSTLFSAFGPEPVVGEAANLKTEEPKVGARITTVDPPYSRWRIQSIGDVFDIDGIALINHNIKDNGYFRLVSDLALEVLIPTIIISSSNVVGTVSKIENEISNPDGNFIVPSSPGTNWSLIVGFNNVGVVAKTGTAMGIIGVSVEVSGTPVDVYPAVKVELRDNGSLIHSFGYRAVTKSEILLFPFDPTLLAADPDFDNIEVGLYFFPGDNSSYAKLETANIYYEDATTVHNVDSLWVSVGQSWVSAKDGNVPTRSIHYLFSNTVENVDDLHLIVLNDESTHNPPTGEFFGSAYTESATVAGLPPVPIDGFIEIGSVVLGTAIRSDPGITIDSTFPASSILSESSGGTTVAGQTFAFDAFSRRAIPSPVDLLVTRDVKMTLLSNIWQRGKAGPFYVIQEPDLGVSYQIFSSFYCTCNRITTNAISDIHRSGGENRSQDLFLVTLDLEERL